MIRERIVRIHIDDEAINFTTDEQIRAFQHALGRLSTYGLRAGDNRGLESVDVSINGSREIAAAFHPPVQWKPEGPSSAHAPFFSLSTAITAFMSDEPFVIAAVSGSDGDYSFHT